MQSKWLWKGTSSRGADGSWLQKLKGLQGWTRLPIPKCCSHWRDPSCIPMVPGARCQGADGDHHRGLKTFQPPAPRCLCGLSWCWPLLLGRGLEVENG